MKLLISGFAFLLFLTSAVGCSSVGVVKTEEGKAVAVSAVSAESIKVYSTKDIGTNYTILGVVVADADAGQNSNVPIRLLKKQASFLGADAIVDMRLEIDYGNWDSAIKATGIAVKFENK